MTSVRLEWSKNMTKKELLILLKSLVVEQDREWAHAEADRLLIEYINDPDVARVYKELGKWYA